MNNETTTKANPVNPNKSSTLNTAHKGICQASQGVQVRYTGEGGSVSTNQKNLSDEPNEHLAYAVDPPVKLANVESNIMKNIMTSNNNSTTTKTNGNQNVIRSSSFTFIKKPSIAEEGQHRGVITNVEEVRITEKDAKTKQNVESVRLEITAKLAKNGNGQEYTLVKGYNMDDNARGHALFLKDYNALTGEDLGRYEIYKADPAKLRDMQVIVEISHKNSTKEAEAVIKGFLPVATEAETATEQPSEAQEVAA